MSNYFWEMTYNLNRSLFFKDGHYLFSIFLWFIFPITLATWVGWIIGDILYWHSLNKRI